MQQQPHFIIDAATENQRTKIPAEQKMDLGENIELFASATGAVLAADQIMKSINSEEHAVSHLVKAGIGPAEAIGAYELLLRAQNEDNASGNGSHVSGHSSRSASPHSRHHDRHLAEEIIGAYGLGKELLGNMRHHISHIVE